MAAVSRGFYSVGFHLTARNTLTTTKKDLQGTVTAFAAASNVSLFATVLAPDVSDGALADVAVTLAAEKAGLLMNEMGEASEDVVVDLDDTDVFSWPDIVGETRPLEAAAVGVIECVAGFCGLSVSTFPLLRPLPLSTRRGRDVILDHSTHLQQWASCFLCGSKSQN